MFRKYHYVDTALSWWEAQAHCRREFVDLATVTDQEDADALLRALPAAGIYAWIGLQDDLTKWSWSMTNMSFNNNTDYSNWEKETMDNSKSRDKCALMKSSGTWLDQPCEEEQPSVCYDGRRGIYFKGRGRCERSFPNVTVPRRLSQRTVSTPTCSSTNP